MSTIFVIVEEDIDPNFINSSIQNLYGPYDNEEEADADAKLLRDSMKHIDCTVYELIPKERVRQRVINRGG